MTVLDPTDDIALSATVILIRERSDMQTLMVQRSTKMGFAGGAIVFPGGKVDGADYETGSVHIDQTDKAVCSESVTRIAAIRELFEETGVLLASREGKLITGADINSFSRHLSDVRIAVYEDAKLFDEFLKAESLEPATDLLTLFAQWRTPPALHRRFDTWFYLAKMPDGQDVTPDGNESTEAMWGSARSFLEQGARGDRKIIFPTARNLELLDMCASFDELLQSTRARTIECIEPVVVERAGDKILTIPEGLGYPVIEEKLETALRT